MSIFNDVMHLKVCHKFLTSGVLGARVRMLNVQDCVLTTPVSRVKLAISQTVLT
jgi:hypothetical protein